MKRRDFLKATGAFAAHLIGNSIILTPALMKRAQASTGYPLAALRSAILQDDAIFLVSQDADFEKYNNAMNLRTKVTPQIRALCRTPQAVSATITWAKQNGVPFSIRGGGHSFEGLSQSPGLTIDGRAMKSIQISDDGKTVTVGAGCALGEIYKALATRGLAIPAGSCPTVGVAGHVLGGGMGLLGRAFGLSCDGLQAVQMVDAQGQILNASENENPDLFWAMRGGGSGSFGVVTQFVLATHELAEVSTCGISWELPIEKAQRVLKAWQAWAPNAPSSITTFLRVRKHNSGQIAFRCAGQSTESEESFRAELNKWIDIEKPSSVQVSTYKFIDAVAHFSGSDEYEIIFMKGRSDYLLEPMSDEGILTLLKGLTNLPNNTMVAIFESYGGAIGNLAPDETAFNHRNAICCVQYYSHWGSAENTPARVGYSRQFY